MDIILKYFPNLSEVQQQQFAALYELYTDWNSKINVIREKTLPTCMSIMCCIHWALPRSCSSVRKRL